MRTEGLGQAVSGAVPRIEVDRAHEVAAGAGVEQEIGGVTGGVTPGPVGLDGFASYVPEACPAQKGGRGAGIGEGEHAGPAAGPEAAGGQDVTEGGERRKPFVPAGCRPNGWSGL